MKMIHKKTLERGLKKTKVHSTYRYRMKRDNQVSEIYKKN